ncbi:GTP-binding protein [Salinicola salarius]|uniref:GTP-binding protein n=1 Tax=Salinicola salarius TaxID=430457 RepID=UPI000B3FBD6A|nr:GTP-binding protein [Salinicola salarius]
MVDASAFTRHVEDMAINDIVVAQIREVSKLRINRVDWLTDAKREQILQSIAALNPTAHRVVEKAGQSSALPVAAATRGSGPLVTESVEFSRVIDLAVLETLLSEAAPTLVRAKGLVQANDNAGSYHVIQLAGGRLTRTVTRAHQSRALVVIGYPGNDMDRLITSLRAL